MATPISTEAHTAVFYDDEEIESLSSEDDNIEGRATKGVSNVLSEQADDENKFHNNMHDLQNATVLSSEYAVTRQAQVECRDEDRSFFHLPDFLLGKYYSYMRMTPWRYSWQERSDMLFSLGDRGYERDAEELARSIFRKRIRWWLIRGGMTTFGVCLSVVAYYNWENVKRFTFEYIIKETKKQFQGYQSQLQTEHPYLAWMLSYFVGTG